ncbi:TetR/AcrR family transcriptional regulator [Microbacterium saperdae]|uniref:TetR family transcriptional regulator n=1 Tax=Microbacterium saperdae TaxID=69368 RepID=A0A543BCA6_9MICO|nr:TetR/AcrR family transcriptional regulator [Microbacterium saperdae]TQL82475.1 TetR family transcriptional regulator [Microbacterium saperdae]GGM40185.1 TetR family transcriptional regulator [Microbacterium saperdae]
MARRGSYAKGVARREEILESALDVIGRKGYQNASLKEIAEVVGVTPAALLHYFGSKEELFTEVLRKRDEHDGLDPAFLDADAARAGFIDVIRHNTQVPGLVALFSRLSVDAADPEHPAHQYFLDRSERLRETFVESFGPGGHGRPVLEPETLARVIQAASDGLQLQWMIDPTVDMPAIMEALIGALYPPAPPAALTTEPQI